MLKVKSIFGPTIQGEGTQAGMPAVFVRFAGCNMWNGKAETRAASRCPFCDTDFVGGREMFAHEIVKEIADRVPYNRQYLIVFTGGEPLLQNAEDLIEVLKLLKRPALEDGSPRFLTQVETNGVRDSKALMFFDFVTCSPKLDFNLLRIDWELVDTIKFLWPHPSVKLEPFLNREWQNRFGIVHLFLQPIDVGTSLHSEANVRETVRKVKEIGLPWRLSLQTHKILGEE